VQLELELIAAVFNQIFTVGVVDATWWYQEGAAIEDRTSGRPPTRGGQPGNCYMFSCSDWMSPHTVFVTSQSHSVEVRVKPTVSCAQAVKLDPYLLGALHPGGVFVN